MKVLKLLIVTLLMSSILLAGCSSDLDSTPLIEGDSENQNTSGDDPVDETFEEDTVNDSDDVEIGELI